MHGLVGLHLHQRRHVHRPRLAHHRQVVAEQVDDHQVLGAGLGVGGQPDAQRLVLLGRATARRGALDRLGLERPVGPDEGVALRRRAQQPGARARHVVLQEALVRRGVELAQPQVRRRGVDVGDDVDAGRSGSPRRSCRRAAPPAPARRPRRTPAARRRRPRAPTGTRRWPTRPPRGGRRTRCHRHASTPRRAAVRRAGPAGRVGRRTRSSRPTSSSCGPVGELGLEGRERVARRRRRPVRRRAGSPRRAPRRSVRETSSSASRPIIDRLPDHSRAPPPSSQKQRRCVAATSRKWAAASLLIALGPGSWPRSARRAR